MLRSFYSGISGLRNHQQAMDVLGNNIANVNTIGFKGSQVTFMDTLSQTIQGGRQAGETSGGRNPSQVGLGMTVAGITRDFGQGALQTTGNSLDLAIQGKGFFIVGQGNNFFYSRSGALGLDDNNNMVTTTGDFVYGWVDTNRDGVVDVRADELQWINLDRRGDGKVTNVRSSVTPPVQGPNKGDGSLGSITTSPTTITDDWRVEVVDAANGLFQVVGTKTGVLVNEAGTAGSNETTSVGQVFTNAKLGTFVLNGGLPRQGELSVRYDDDRDGTTDATIHVTAVSYGAGGNDIQVEIINSGRSKSLGVTVLNNKITVNLGTDEDGLPLSTRQQIVDAINEQAGDLAHAELLDASGVSSDTTTSAAVSAAVAAADIPGATVADLVAAAVKADPNQGYAVRAVKTEAQDPAATVASVVAAAAAAAAAVPVDAAGTARAAELTSRYLQGGSGVDLGDYFSYKSTAPGGAALQTMTIAADGTILGIFENGTTEEIARLALGVVANPQGLLTVGDGKYAESPTSGPGFPPVVAGSGGSGTLAAGFLEMSNVDLTREFTDMIVMQRGFQANSRIITTSDEMLQDLLALKR